MVTFQPLLGILNLGRKEVYVERGEEKGLLKSRTLRDCQIEKEKLPFLFHSQIDTIARKKKKSVCICMHVFIHMYICKNIAQIFKIV